MLATGIAASSGERDALERRINVFLLVMLASVALLLGRLGYLQVVRGAYYETLSRGNRIRLVSLTAPRGQMLDRTGKLLATTRPAFAASLVYLGEKYSPEVLTKLEEILSLEPGKIDTLMERWRDRLYLPVRLKNDITPEEHSRLEEHRNELPGLVIEVIPIREYPNGQLAAHALGRVGFLNTESTRESLQEQAADHESILGAAGMAPAAYELDDIVGVIGLERQYDAILRGVDGTREVEVNSLGTPTRVEREIPPQAGLTLGLTLDLDLQATLDQALVANMESVRKSRGPAYSTSAAAIVLDVKTGGVLAMTSVPTFDPNWSASGRIDPEFLPQMEEFNRVIQGLYIPGSTYKMMTAVTALQEGIVTTADGVWCGGGYRLGSHFIGCWVGAPGHGRVNILDAIKGSCNTFFIEMGMRLRSKAQETDATKGFVDMLSKYAAGFGLDGPTGIDLPFERAGRSPRTAGRSWLVGEDVQCAIGQSRQEYSPLQLAHYVATLANDGKRLRPHLVNEIRDGDTVLWHAVPEQLPGADNVSAETIALVKQGMLAVTGPGGTAYSSFWDLPIKAGAKTGTAQTGQRPNDGLFVGFAPYDDPQIAWAVVVKNGDSGSLSGAPVARELIKTYFGLRPPQEAASQPSASVPGEETANEPG